MCIFWKVIFILSAFLLLWTLSEFTFSPTSKGNQQLQLDCGKQQIANPSSSLLLPQHNNATIMHKSYYQGHTLSMLSVLLEIEPTLLFHSNSSSKPLVVAKDISYGRYYGQRDMQGWSIAYRNMSFDFVEQSFRTQVKLGGVSVFLCLGIQAQDKHCLRPTMFQFLLGTQRYNQIHGIRDILWRKDAFCYTMREALRGYKGEKNFTFPCWVLPKDRVTLEKEMNRTKSSWIVKPSGQGEGHGIFVVNYMSEILKDHTSFTNFVVQPLMTDSYLVEGRKFDFRTYVLITSMIPLRAYIYKEGLVRFASSRYNRSIAKGGSKRQYLTNTSLGKKYMHLVNLTWTFQKLKDYFIGKGVDSEVVFERINEAIVRVLLSAEYRFQRNFALNLKGYDCQRCFHLLGVDVILDASLHPVVIEVNGLPSMQLSHDLGVPPDLSNLYTITKLDLMRDMLQIIFKPTSVAEDLSHHLQLLRVGITPGFLCNLTNHVHCVDYKDLQKLLDSRREFVNRGGYQRIYPSSNGEKYAKLIKRMNDLIVKKFAETGTASPRTLWQTHHLQAALEKLYTQSHCVD